MRHKRACGLQVIGLLPLPLPLLLLLAAVRPPADAASLNRVDVPDVQIHLP
jgi:hypothetical protein